MWDLVVGRIVLIAVVGATTWYLRPFGLQVWWLALAAGLAAGLLIVLLEMRLRKAAVKRLIGATAGCLLGLVAAWLACLILGLSHPFQPQTMAFLQLGLLGALAYIGLAVGASKAEILNLAALGGLFGADKAAKKSAKILDTSVIIDGRIADICETCFLDGTLVIPQFVLRELQMVADSADSMKRNRGRRGLDVLHRVQKMSHVEVQIIEEDFPHIRDVDMKLIELAKRHEGKIVTNDFNLNKVAQLHGVEVLNINELTNALKPVVLPGEVMRVFILKEGKEYNQGVAYLDDGTMVVVDNAKRMISKTVDVSVTSVLQTTAGKMIFGRYDERAEQRPPTHGPERGSGSQERYAGHHGSSGSSGGRERSEQVVEK